MDQGEESTGNKYSLFQYSLKIDWKVSTPLLHLCLVRLTDCKASVYSFISGIYKIPSVPLVIINGD